MKTVLLFLSVNTLFHFASAQTTLINNSVLATGQWAKVGVTQEGIYKLDASQLGSLGISANPFPSSAVRLYGRDGSMLNEKIDNSYIDDLVEIPIETGSNYLLFYAPGPHQWKYDSASKRFNFVKNLHSDTAWYFITLNTAGTPKRIITLSPETRPATSIVNSYTHRYAHETNRINLLSSGKEWLGESFVANNNTRTFTVLWNNTINSTPIQLYTHLTSRSLGANANFTVSVNDQAIQNINLNGVTGGLLDEYARDAKTLSPIGLNTIGNFNSLSVKFQYSSFANGAEGWLNRFSVQGQRQLIPDNNTSGFYFRNTMLIHPDSIAEYRINAPLNNGTPTVFSADTRVWNISNPLNPQQVIITNAGNEITFKSTVEILKEYALFNPSQALTPIIPSNPNIPNQSLHGLAHGASGTNYPGTGSNNFNGIIVVHPSLLPAANRLAAFHQSQYGYTDAVITTTQFYNEFSGGIPDPAGIRNGIKLFYDLSKPITGSNSKTLQYVVLFGAGSYDYKNIISSDRNLVPTFQSSNSLSPLLTYTSDDFYALLNNNDDINLLNDAPLSIAVGRLPVGNLQEANTLVDKIIRYHTPPNSSNTSSANADNSWRNQLVFIADDKDQNLHLNDAESIAATAIAANPAAHARKIYLDAFPLVSGAGGARYPSVSEAIVNQVLAGALIVNYSGHGNHLRLSEEAVISAAEVNRFNNPNKLPLFITASCDFDPFDQPSKPSIARTLLYGSNNGAIALLTTTRLVFAYSNRIMNQNYLQLAMEPLPTAGSGTPAGQATGHLYRSLGQATMDAKNRSNQLNGDPLNSRKFALLGDPAMQLAFPELPMRINQITDQSSGASVNLSDSLLALRKYKITGQVSQLNGAIQSNFNGIANVQLYDQAQTVFTLGNSPESPRTAYSTENSILFNGKATVTNGLFNIEFIVPKDINFGPGKATIRLFAQASNNGGGSSNFAQSAAGALPIRIAGSTGAIIRDTTGPQIKLYLYDTAFKNGGITSENPILIAQLYDTSGINATGNGIGHDIVLVQNNDERNSIVLNSFFSTELNQYQRGEIRYQLATLPEGKYQLKLKAWDLVNNSNQALLDFTVVKKNQLRIAQVRNYPNPVRHNGGHINGAFTVFAFEHNQPNTNLLVNIEIVNTAGALVKRIQQTINTQGSRNIQITWDGTSETGAKYTPGIYFYRINISALSNPQLGTARAAGQIIML
ncbi:type IX secretion system sortase PorU [Sediminibacterium sp.]|uniref:type IX secretion system sortase PorU n=1 Tax=Sediminibacterium sp. TaxID=1917865 RepID=UPI0025D16D5C|nr:type IX secretion system sortase PorU [Sediminibacterium sp.]MBT9485690.1 type IX secretion system sortase PorU [Sediminibacterium sp.]